MWLLGVVIGSKNVLPRKKNYFYLQVTFRTQKSFYFHKYRPAFLQCQSLHDYIHNRIWYGPVSAFSPCCGSRSGSCFRLWWGYRTDFSLDADPDPAPHQSIANLRPLPCRLSAAPFRASMSPLWAIMVLHGSILNIYSSWILTLMRIRIRLVTLMRIRIWLSKFMGSGSLKKILDPDPNLYP